MKNNIPKIKVVGIGGSGVNAITRMAKEAVVGVELIAANTDAQSLKACPVAKKVLLGKTTTKGLGAGMDVKLGQKAARESEEELKSAIQGAELVFLTCGLGGGCLRGSSTVWTNPEGPVRIDSIGQGSMVYTFHNNHLVKRRVLAAMKTGVKRVLELKTNNRTIYASEDHPFLRVKPLNNLSNNRFSDFGLEWTELRDLSPGDLVVVLRKLPAGGAPLELPANPFLNKTNREFCQLFGFLLGDGWIVQRGRSWAVFFSPSNNEEHNQQYLNLFEGLFGLGMKKTTSANWYYRNSKDVGALLEKLGLHKPSGQKEVPNWVFGLPLEQKKAFIIGLADADGSYSVQKSRNGLPKKEIKFEMSSEKLIKGLKVLCDSIGLRTSNVTSRTRLIKAPNSPKAILFTSWMLRIYKTHELLGELPHPDARAGLGFLYKFRSRRPPEFFENFGFNRIKSIKDMGEEEVYDITVEGSHNFIADGFVVHNSGSSGIPILGEISKSLGALTLAVVTLPFSFEGIQRRAVAGQALKNLDGKVDALLTVPNDKLLGLVKPNTTVQDAFLFCDGVLREAVKGISDLVSLPGIINVDFADLRGILENSGRALLGIGIAKGEKRAFVAASSALRSPLLDFSFRDSDGILLNIAGGDDLSLSEVNTAASFVKRSAQSRAKIVFGVSEDATLKEGEIKVTVIATSKK